MKRLFVWPGGKSREFKTIQQQADYSKAKIYVEPFLGSGFSFLNIEGFDKYIINDISHEVINVFKNIKKMDKIFLSTLKLHIEIWDNIDINKIREYYTEEEILNQKLKYIKKWGNNSTANETVLKQLYFNYVRKRYNTFLSGDKLVDPLAAADFMFLRQYSFSGMLRYSQTGEYNVPYGGFRYNSRSLLGKLNLIKSHDMKKKMEATEIHNLDFEKFMKKIPKKSFVFLDPPYDSEFSTYTGDEFDFLQQTKLRDVIKESDFDFFAILLETKRIKKIYDIPNFLINTNKYSYGINIKNRQKEATNVKHLYIERNK